MISRSDARSLPERWRRGRERAALVIGLLLALFCVAFSRQGGAEVSDAWWLRARFSGRETLENWNRDGSTAKNSQDWAKKIVLVELDDHSVAEWDKKFPNQPLIMWGGHIADALNTITRSGAHSVALDWTQPVETDAAFHWGNDQKLGEALSRAPRVVMVKMVAPNGKYVLPASSLLYSVPGAVLDGGKRVLGVADLINRNGVQTSFFTHIEDEITFPALIAQNNGSEARASLRPRADGSWLIHFRSNAGETGAKAPYTRLSLFDVANAKGVLPVLKDKIVIIGQTNKGNNDSHFVPFLNGLSGARQIWGLEVQAHILSTILNGDAIEEPGYRVVALLATLLGVMGVGVVALWSWSRATLATIALMGFWTLTSFVCFCALNLALPLILPLASLLLGAGAMGGYRALSEERERAQVMKVVGRYQDPRIIAEFLANPEWSGGQGRELFVTVLFADLKNFTQTVEHLAPSPSLEALNRYLSLLSTAILRHDGLVDKYLGDGLMAQWGAPKERGDHAVLALRACLEIMEEVQKLTRKLENETEVSFEVRLTLHTGPVVAGPIGSPQRLEYTLIGDTVNVCSRLQETAKALECDFLISQTTCEALSDQVQSGQLRIGREVAVEIRGRTQPLRVFEVLMPQNDAISVAPIATTANLSQVR